MAAHSHTQGHTSPQAALGTRPHPKQREPHGHTSRGPAPPTDERTATTYAFNTHADILVHPELVLANVHPPRDVHHLYGNLLINHTCSSVVINGQLSPLCDRLVYYLPLRALDYTHPC